MTLGVSGPIRASSRVDDISSGAPGAACTPPPTGTGRAAPVLPSCEPSIMKGSRSSAKPVPVLAADEPADAQGADRRTTVGLLCTSVVHTWSDALPLRRTLHWPPTCRSGAGASRAFDRNVCGPRTCERADSGGQPGVREELFKGDALHRVAFQQARQQAPAGGRQVEVGGDARRAALDVAQQLNVVVACGGWSPGMSSIAEAATLGCLRVCQSPCRIAALCRQSVPAVRLTMERWPPRQQLKQNGADAPQVRLGVILVEVEDFRGHVQR